MQRVIRGDLFESAFTLSRAARSQVQRAFCSETRSDKVENRHPKKVRAPDTPYVTHRNAYLTKVSKLRKEFYAEWQKQLGKDDEASASQKAEFQAEAATRKAAKRAKSEAAQIQLRAEREKQAIQRAERRAYNFSRFQERCAASDKIRLARVANLEAAAETWITEQNMQDKLDELLDSIFIAKEAADHARSSGSSHF